MGIVRKTCCALMYLLLVTLYIKFLQTIVFSGLVFCFLLNSNFSVITNTSPVFNVLLSLWVVCVQNIPKCLL
ncbi:hypothetical protein Hamer_G005402 [Homarus americanus]|uniref:Uncharacterized protein n=1 Tax=Homarus americanus TaxID=6706 RepID=A0A8J5JYQ3_HOMAM|nr:hypothetical protein Hamer_G005402 [Homarus americanus]